MIGRFLDLLHENRKPFFNFLCRIDLRGSRVTSNDSARNLLQCFLYCILSATNDHILTTGL
jgi:hypothetical protein